MNSQVEVVGPCRKQLSIEIPADKVSEAMKEVAGSYLRHAKIPGFRPGKAPLDLVKRRFQKEINKDMKEYLVPRGYQSALQEQKIKVVKVIDVTDPELVEGQPYVFQVTVDVFPDFALPDYKAIRIEERPVEVTDDAVSEVIDDLRDRQATYEDVPGRVAEKTDQVTVNWKAMLDGKPLEESVKGYDFLAKTEGFGVILDEGFVIIPEFVSGLLGAAAGETRTIEVNFEENYVVKELGGKKAVYTVEVIKVGRRKLPELTADWVKSIGANSEDELREHIRKDLIRSKTDQEQRRIRDEICKKLIESTAMNLPESSLQEQTADEVYDLVDYNSRRGIDREAIEQNREQIFSTAGKVAEDKLKLRFILQRIAEEEQLKVSEADVNNRIQMMAIQARKDPAKLKEELKKNERLPLLHQDLVVTKALNFLAAQSQPQPTPA
jgi:trigger factor